MSKAHGGARPNSGRKPKADELKLVEQMDGILHPDDVWVKVAERIHKGDMNAAKLWLEYRYGKPKQSIDHTSDGLALPAPLIVFPKDEQI